MTRYFVTTFDGDKQKWTPQQGVRTGPYSKFSLRKAIRKLRAIGYPCDYRSAHGGGDNYVFFEAVEAETQLSLFGVR